MRRINWLHVIIAGMVGYYFKTCSCPSKNLSHTTVPISEDTLEQQPQGLY